MVRACSYSQVDLAIHTYLEWVPEREEAINTLQYSDIVDYEKSFREEHTYPEIVVISSLWWPNVLEEKTTRVEG